MAGKPPNGTVHGDSPLRPMSGQGAPWLQRLARGEVGQLEGGGIAKRVKLRNEPNSVQAGVELCSERSQKRTQIVGVRGGVGT